MATATVIGPITGGVHGRPFGSALADLGALGYIEEEYFLSGEAVAFRPDGELTSDGRWQVSPADTEPYVTRLLVRRPRDPEKFNGTVIAEWTNVTSGFEAAQGDVTGVYEGGYAHVAISAQSIGITGFAVDSKGLLAWDLERYGALRHPGDSHSYDIFTQATHVVGPNRGDLPLDPMGGLTVRRVIATGASQSAMRLVTYANAITPLGHEVDGFVVTLYVGSAYTFTDAGVDASNLLSATPEEQAAIFGIPTSVRAELDVPFFLLNTECESVTYAPVRQPDTETFRYWEIAGAAHAPGPSMKDMAEVATRDFGRFDISEGLVDPNLVPSMIDWRPVQFAAYRHMGDWIETGTVPPTQPKLVLGEDGQVRRDVRGNAVGGTRLPDVDAPVAAYNGGGVLPGSLGLSGQTVAFDPETIRELYPDHDDFVAAVRRAAGDAVAAGVILQRRADEYIADAESARVP